MPASVSIGISGETLQQNDFSVGLGNHVKIELPTDLSRKTLDLAIRDAEIVSSIWKEHPETMTEILKHVTDGNLGHARKLAGDIKFDEKSFVDQGGGLWALVAVIAIGAAVLLAHD